MNRRPETISPLFFIPLEPYPARFARHLPHAGKALFRKYRFPHPTSAPSGHLLPYEGGSVHASPFPWKGLLSAARRGWLPFLRRSGALANGALEKIFPALFHTARTLSGSLRSPPSPRGEGFVSEIPLPPSNLHPFGAPPSIGWRECPRKPLPLEGAAERSEARLASFLGSARVLSLTAYLRRSSSLFLIPPEPYPARSARHLPHAGKALPGKRYSCFFIHPTQKRPSLTSGRF